MADRRDLVITSPGSIGLEDAPELVPGPGEVVARPVHTGICGTDLNNDLLISASFAYTSVAFAEVTGLLSSGQIRPAPLITHRFPLEAYEQAYQVLREGSGPRGKVMLDVSAP